METSSFPENLVECVRFYSDPENCFNFAVSMRWPEGITCPYCNSRNHTFMSSRKMWQCNDCRKQFSVKVGTIFEESRLSLDKWFIAAWLIGNSKNGISSHEIARHLGVTQKTAWF